MDAPLEILTHPSRVARYWTNVKQGDSDACWLWSRSTNGSGYGVHRCGSQGVSYSTMAHRVAWILTHNQAIPDGMVVDHLCSVRACCNPAHLRAVDVSTNVRASTIYKAGTSKVVREGPRTIRPRGSRFMVIWREYLADGSVRQAGRTVLTREEALAML